MSFDLYSKESEARISSLPPVSRPEPGMFEGFLSGTGSYAMQGLAKAGRAIDMLGAVGPIVQDKVSGTGTQAQDRYFKEHDEVFNRAVDYWTPKPGEVGAAAEITGQLLSTLPLVIASPGLAVAGTQLSTAEDLVRKGVDAGKAQAVGAVQAAGLGLGIWMPIIGQNLWQRVVVGGAGFNVAQGIVTRGASGAILSGTAAADDFKAFDGSAVTLDLVLGAAFGAITHLSPEQRAQGAQYWKRIEDWAKTLKPSEIDALATLRQSQHLNVDSAPGKAAGPADVEAHVTAMRQAITDLLNDKPVNVENIVREASFLPDEQRAQFQKDMQAELTQQARQMVLDAIASRDARAKAEDTPGFLRTADDLLALKTTEDAAAPRNPELARAIEIAQKPGFQLTAQEKIFLNSVLSGNAFESLIKTVPEPAPRATPPESLLPEAAGVEPLQAEAARFADANPDLNIAVMKPDGTEAIQTVKQYLDDADNVVKQAADDAKLFEVAAACMLGAG